MNTLHLIGINALSFFFGFMVAAVLAAGREGQNDH